MRIISKDKNERIVKCKCCNSEIAYKMSEAFTGLFDVKYISCPVCKEDIRISIFNKVVENND